MARSLKSRGLLELKSFRARVRRQHALGRISRPDAEWLIGEVDKIETRVVTMSETNEQGEEEE